MDPHNFESPLNFTVASSSEYISTSSCRFSDGGDFDVLVPTPSYNGSGIVPKSSSAASVVMATVLPSPVSNPSARQLGSSKLLMVRPQGCEGDPNAYSSFSSVDSLSRSSGTLDSSVSGSLSGSVLSPPFSELHPSVPSLHPPPPHHPQAHRPEVVPQQSPAPLMPLEPMPASSMADVLGELTSSLPPVDPCPSGLMEPGGVGGSEQPTGPTPSRPPSSGASSKPKLSPVRPLRTTKLLLPKPASSQAASGLAYLFPSNFNIPPQLQSVLGGAISQAKMDAPASQLNLTPGPIINKSTPPTIDPSVKSGMPVAPLHSKPRRPCNCKASKCLKLYCDCFANGEFCRPTCNCSGCHNNMLHERDRATAIKVTIERNPLAFHPKVAKQKQGDTERRHIKGCHCKRSGCLKNYCECYEAKIPCSSLCKCLECKNRPGSEMKSLLHLADVAENCPYQQKPGVQLLKELENTAVKPLTKLGYGRRLPLAFVNQSVIEACALCLLQVGSETLEQPQEAQELRVIKEFGNCLEQIISAAKDAATSQTTL